MKTSQEKGLASIPSIDMSEQVTGHKISNKKYHFKRTQTKGHMSSIFPK